MQINMVSRSFMSRFLFFVCIACVSAVIVSAQQPVSSSPAAPVGSSRGLYLVFPFENAGASPRLDWLSEGLEELTIQYLSAAGEEVYSHAGRAGELERYGLPSSAKLSRATMLRIAQDLDADYVVFGSFASDGTSLTIESRILRVDPTALLANVRESAPLDTLMDLQTRVVWRLLSSNQRSYPLSLAEFAKIQCPLRLDAFEHFVRGLLANEDEARLRELREAARLEPTWSDPAFALGETYAARSDCSSALPWFTRVPKTNPRYVEAIFAIGVCRLQLNQPDKAEESFSLLQGALRDPAGPAVPAATQVSGADLPEILNNLGVALSRQGKASEAQADLRRATDLDPDEDDYPFNLGLVALRSGDFKSAVGYFREASQREPDNPEDRALLIHSLDKSGNASEADQERVAAAEALGPNAISATRIDAKGDALAGLDRVKTSLDITTLRLEIESSAPATLSASAGTADNTTTSHIRRGRQELSAGALDAAETDFRAALTADPSNAAAHQSLGELDRRRGNLDAAVTELQASLKARDSAVVRTALARLYLEQKKPELARAEAQRALTLAPNYADAKQLLERMQTPKQSKPGGVAQ
jgi:tetratricopeptide (TPR) repeat protein/TolB-like protein